MGRQGRMGRRSRRVQRRRARAACLIASGVSFPDARRSNSRNGPLSGTISTAAELFHGLIHRRRRAAQNAPWIAKSVSAAVAAMPRLLRIGGSPLQLRDDARQVRSSQHIVERGELAAHDVAQLSLRSLEAIFEILLHGELLAGRLEIAACEPIRKIPELLDEFRSPANAVLAAAR